MLRTSRYSLLLWLHCCFNILCKLYALHWKVFVKYRLCLNFLLAIQENCWRIASGTDTGEILIKQHQFWGGVGGGEATLWSHLGRSGSLMLSSFFKIYSRGVWHCHSGRAKATQEWSNEFQLMLFCSNTVEPPRIWKVQKSLRLPSSPIFPQVYTVLQHAMWRLTNCGFSSNCCGKNLPQIYTFAASVLSLS